MCMACGLLDGSLAVHVAVTTLDAAAQSTRAPHEVPHEVDDLGATSHPLVEFMSQSK